MKVRCVVAGLGLVAVLYANAAAAFVLITPDEAKAAPRRGPDESEPMLKRGMDAKAPLIRLNQPDLTKPIRSPVNIDVAFEAAPDAQIVPDSFKVRYLFLDLTDRMRKHATIDRSGVRVRGAELPAGSFRIVFEVADTLRRTGRLEVVVNVE